MNQMTRAEQIATEFRQSGSVEASTETRPEPPPTEATEPGLGREGGVGRPTPHGPLHLNGHIHLSHGGHSGTDDASRDDERADAEREAPRGELVDRAPADGSLEPPTAPAGSSAGAAGSRQPVHQPQHETLPGIARAAAGGFLQAAGWTAGTSLRVSNQLRRIAVDPGSAQEVIDEVTAEVREIARDFLGITELDEEVREMAPLLSSGLLKTGGSSPETLRAQGEQLLRAAADVGFDESAHPAFARILTELSPDEARILRLLAIEGAQPLVDVRASNLIGNGSQLIAQSLNMLGPKSGLRQRERVPVYLTNLVRLSLVELCDDPLESPVEYQVLEAQPEVLATLKDTVRAKTIRRSIRLTPLGDEFCEVCLPVNLPQLPAPRVEG